MILIHIYCIFYPSSSLTPFSTINEILLKFTETIENGKINYELFEKKQKKK